MDPTTHDWKSKIFANPIILNSIIDHLPVQDTKNLRLVSYAAEDYIVRGLRFHQQIKLKIDKSVVKDPCFLQLQPTWKSLTLILYDGFGLDPQENEVLFRLLEKAETISIDAEESITTNIGWGFFENSQLEYVISQWLILSVPCPPSTLSKLKTVCLEGRLKVLVESEIVVPEQISLFHKLKTIIGNTEGSMYYLNFPNYYYKWNIN